MSRRTFLQDNQPPDPNLHGYLAAVRERDRLLARATWWDRWRASLVLPMILVGGGGGLLAGMALRVVLHLPEKTDFFGAAIGIAVLGRLVTRYFDINKLELARRRVDALAPRRNSDES